jgi:hypothetical protein
LLELSPRIYVNRRAGRNRHHHETRVSRPAPLHANMGETPNAALACFFGMGEAKSASAALPMPMLSTAWVLPAFSATPASSVSFDPRRGAQRAPRQSGPSSPPNVTIRDLALRVLERNDERPEMPIGSNRKNGVVIVRKCGASSIRRGCAACSDGTTAAVSLSSARAREVATLSRSVAAMNVEALRRLATRLAFEA